VDFSSARSVGQCGERRRRCQGQPSKNPQAKKAYRGKPTVAAPATLSACSAVLPDALPSTESGQFVIGKSLEGGRFIILSSRMR